MQEIEPHPLLDAIEAFCAKNGMSRSKFGAMAVGDPGFVFGLAAGRDPRRQTVARVRQFISEFQAPEAAE